MAPLKHFLAVAMAGLVLLTASVSTDGAAMPAMTSSVVDAPRTVELASAVARVGATNNAAKVVKGLSGAAPAADKEALALDDASGRTYGHGIVCKKFKVFKVCKKIKFVCRRKYVVHKLAAPDANGGAAAVNPAVAEADIDEAARNVKVDTVNRTFGKDGTVQRSYVLYKKAICIRLVCRLVKKCIFFY